MQFMARYGDEATLFRLAGQYIKSDDGREIPDWYPSYRTTAPMGIEVRRSALPHPVSSDPVNYVYLTWTSGEKVFMSVLHNLNNRHRFTRSMDTFRTAHPDTGASFVRGQSVNYHILPVWLNGQQRPYSAHLYGRY